MKCYIYGLTNPLRHNELFYVGVGTISIKAPLGARPARHLREARLYKDENKLTRGANPRKLRTINQIEEAGEDVGITFMATGLSKEDAIALEIQTIARVGRLDLGTGPLTNLTGGGDGATLMSEESRTRVAETNRQRGTTALKGRVLGPYSDERKQAIAEGVKRSFDNGRTSAKSNLGKKIPDDVRLKISQALKGRPSPMKGKVHPSKGEKRGPMSEGAKAKMKGRPAHNKGEVSPNRGRTYEEIYGPEKAAELREKRRQQKLEYHATRRSDNIVPPE